MFIENGWTLLESLFYGMNLMRRELKVAHDLHVNHPGVVGLNLMRRELKDAEGVLHSSDD